MRMTPDLFVYIVITLFGLWSLAERFAPHEGLSESGCRIGAVYDGDTVELICGRVSESARLAGFDTPETRDAGCEAERALGKRATLYLRDWVRHSRPGITHLGREKFGRRLIRLRLDGQDVGQRMIDQGLAMAYTGGKRIDWCAHLAKGGAR